MVGRPLTQACTLWSCANSWSLVIGWKNQIILPVLKKCKCYSEKMCMQSGILVKYLLVFASYFLDNITLFCLLLDPKFLINWIAVFFLFFIHLKTKK